MSTQDDGPAPADAKYLEQIAANDKSIDELWQELRALGRGYLLKLPELAVRTVAAIDAGTAECDALALQMLELVEAIARRTADAVRGQRQGAPMDDGAEARDKLFEEALLTLPAAGKGVN